jgi:transposase
VVLSIVLDGDDRPIASFLMPGNTADVTMLVPVVKRLEERFGIKRRIVADRGMISAATLAELEAIGIDYILGVRERSRSRGSRGRHRRRRGGAARACPPEVTESCRSGRNSFSLSTTGTVFSRTVH